MERRESTGQSGSRKKSSRTGRQSSPQSRSISSRKTRRPNGSTSGRQSRRRSRSISGRQRRGSSSTSSEPRGRRARRVSKSRLSNLDFPVARVKSMLKVNNHRLRISDKTAVFTTAVLEYLTHELLELSLNVAREEGRSRIQSKHVNKAIKTDAELVRNFKNTSVRDSSFVSLEEMINAQRPRLHQAQDPSVPDASTVSVRSPDSSRKSDSRRITRREG